MPIRSTGLFSALFVVGHAWLFRWLASTPVVAFALAIGLYYTGFAQFWWNEKGPVFALFPWTILPFATRLPIWGKAASDLLGRGRLAADEFLSAPANIVGVCRSCACWRASRTLQAEPPTCSDCCGRPGGGDGGDVSVGLFASDRHHHLPRQRRVPGGSGGLTWLYLRSWLWPAINFGPDYASPNISEVGTPGLYYTLFALCFLDYARWREVWADGERRRQVLILGGALAMMLAWLVLPLPSWVGAPLLWNRIPPTRMQYAAGLLLVCLLFLLIRYLGLRVAPTRLAIFAGLAPLGWWAWEYGSDHHGYEDLGILIFLPPAFALAYRAATRAHASLALASLAAGLALFAGSNPLQSAWPIFNSPASEVTRAFDRLAAGNGGVLAVTGLPGAVGNGLGYRSLSHVTAVPQLAFWRRHFPDCRRQVLYDLQPGRTSSAFRTRKSAPRSLALDSVGVPVSLGRPR